MTRRIMRSAPPCVKLRAAAFRDPLHDTPAISSDLRDTPHTALGSPLRKFFAVRKALSRAILKGSLAQHRATRMPIVAQSQ